MFDTWVFSHSCNRCIQPLISIYPSIHPYQPLRYPYVHPSLHHPRRPRGSQSGQGKRRNKSFQARVEEPLGTESQRAISKRLSECWLVIASIGEQHLLSSLRVFVLDSFCLAILVRFVYKGNFHSLISWRETKELSVTSLSHKLLGNVLATFAVWSNVLTTFAIWSSCLFLGQLD